MGIKNLTYRFLSFFLVVFFVTNLIAQDKPNAKFTYHTVSKGETSYGIAKKYQIDLNEFFNYNPSASNGLSKGDTLKIPIKTFVNQTSAWATTGSKVNPAASCRVNQFAESILLFIMSQLILGLGSIF